MAGPAISAVFHFPFGMTIHTPGHPHRCNTSNPVHGLHWTVTFLTGEARLDMSLMGEVNEVGDVVDFDPRNRFAIVPVDGELLNLLTVADAWYRFMTSHAFANAGYARNGRFVRINVTVLARNLIVRGMNRVTEFDWLDRTAIREIFSVYPCACEKPEHN